MINLRLTIALLGLFFVVSAPVFPAAAQKAMPVTAVEGQSLPPPQTGPVIVELFSSQACVFCPRADRLFADFVGQDGVIGLACHVDYFDVRQGSLSRPFCSARQTWYAERLHAGPAYTPQMIVQGHMDIVGYKMEDAIRALREAALQAPGPLKIEKEDEDSRYAVTLPGRLPESFVGARIWLMRYDRPHVVNVAEGRNRGQKITYYNIVSALDDLGVWAAGQNGLRLTAPLAKSQAGFVVLIQDEKSGKIWATGEYKKEFPVFGPVRKE